MMVTNTDWDVVQRVMESYPEDEWIAVAQKELPALEEAEIIEMVMFLNVGDVVDVAE
jgi:hypothetical protein